MELKLKKQARKYIEAADAKTRKKLFKALDDISRLEGDIVPLAGAPNMYRYKMEHYRIIFEWIKGEIIITVIEYHSPSC